MAAVRGPLLGGLQVALLHRPKSTAYKYISKCEKNKEMSL